MDDKHIPLLDHYIMKRLVELALLVHETRQQGRRPNEREWLEMLNVVDRIPDGVAINEQINNGRLYGSFHLIENEHPDRRVTMACGCEVQDYGQGVMLNYCNMHERADVAFELLREFAWLTHAPPLAAYDKKRDKAVADTVLLLEDIDG